MTFFRCAGEAGGPIGADDIAFTFWTRWCCWAVETRLKHPGRAFIKLEDTIVVTDQGRDL